MDSDRIGEGMNLAIMGKKRAKKQKLEMAVAHIQHRFGHRSLVKGRLPAVASAVSPVPHISTGFPQLDRALNIGGLPKGKMSELVVCPLRAKRHWCSSFWLRHRPMAVT